MRFPTGKIYPPNMKKRLILCRKTLSLSLQPMTHTTIATVVLHLPIATLFGIRLTLLKIISLSAADPMQFPADTLPAPIVCNRVIFHHSVFLFPLCKFFIWNSCFGGCLFGKENPYCFYCCLHCYLPCSQLCRYWPYMVGLSPARSRPVRPSSYYSKVHSKKTKC